MNVTITPAALGGAVTPPPSKSQAHRLIIAAALSDGVCRLSNVELSQDIQATLRCMRTLDADASADGTVIRGADLVDGFETPPPEVMDCGESGSTLRFLIPVALALKGGGRFTGHGRLMERPQEPYFRLFAEKGIAWSLENGVLAVEGRLTPGVYTLPGDVSSQFITGLLYALPLLEGDSELVLTTALESRGYVDMTLDALAQFGVAAEYDGDRRFRVPGNQAYRHRDLAIEGDWSNAAFWFAAAFLGHRVEVEGLNPRSVQGDRVIGEQLARLTRPGPAELDVSQCPDLVPPLAAMAALRAGETTAIVNAARLRDPGAQHPGGRCGGARRPPGAPGQGAAGGGRHRLRPQRPPHRHDGRHCGHPLSGAGDHHRRGVREQVLSPLLGGLRVPWRADRPDVGGAGGHGAVFTRMV